MSQKNWKIRKTSRRERTNARVKARWQNYSRVLLLSSAYESTNRLNVTRQTEPAAEQPAGSKQQAAASASKPMDVSVDAGAKASVAAIAVAAVTATGGILQMILETHCVQMIKT